MSSVPSTSSDLGLTPVLESPATQSSLQQSRISRIANSIFNAVKSCGSFIGGIFKGAWNVVSSTASALTAKVTAVFRREAPQSAVATDSAAEEVVASSGPAAAATATDSATAAGEAAGEAAATDSAEHPSA